jgi:ABC-type antimicrobial peptide transport system permease subunit
MFGDGTQLIVRTSGRASDMIPTLRRELTASDSRLVINSIDALEDIVATTVVERRMAMRLLAALAAMALVLASIGLYGVLSFNVARRERELGVRTALGATRGSLLTLVLRDGVRLALVGVALGMFLALWLTGALRGLLFEVSPTEPRTFSIIAGVLVLVATAASLVPAWRAARVDPVRALRAD